MRWLARLFPRPAPPATLDWATVEAELFCLDHLSADDRARLRQLALEFLKRKTFHGAHGFKIDNAMRMSVALQASLLVLNLGLEHFDRFAGIILYPGEFLAPRVLIDEAGLVSEFTDTLAGQAMDGGPVILSWGVSEPGMNVILHEFAHALDLDGAMPAFLASEWAREFPRAYEDFLARLERGEDTALDDYAAESPAEFFAVMTEAFFETPADLNDEYPAIFSLLKRFYRQDTLPA